MCHSVFSLYLTKPEPSFTACFLHTGLPTTLQDEIIYEEGSESSEDDEEAAGASGGTRRNAATVGSQRSHRHFAYNRMSDSESEEDDPHALLSQVIQLHQPIDFFICSQSWLVITVKLG